MSVINEVLEQLKKEEEEKIRILEEQKQKQKEYQKEYQRKYRKQNKDKYKEYQKQYKRKYRENNEEYREKNKSYQKEYWDQNKEDKNNRINRAKGINKRSLKKSKTLGGKMNSLFKYQCLTNKKDTEFIYWEYKNNNVSWLTEFDKVKK